MERTCSEEHPKSGKNQTSLANEANVCKPKNIAISSLKWNVLCQILLNEFSQLAGFLKEQVRI